MEISKRWSTALLLLSALGCEAKANVRAGGDTTSAKATASTVERPPPAAPTPTSVASQAPPPAADTNALPPGCTLVCVQPNVGRLAAADETRLTSGLAETARA